ncbi:MAG TPA: hypothetical protein PKB14_09360 [Rubrivivax sp.]|mgnify:CR=1 FL=1|nr:hypothetical protein [Rubrivivax sp.]
MRMLGAELSLFVLNAVLLTAVVAPLLLWRYRRAVLCGMMARPAATLAPALPRSPPPATPPQADGDVPAALRWEARVQRRVFIAVLGVVFVCALPLALLFVYLGELPRTPAHVFPKAGVLATLAVPMAAVLIALPLRRAAALWLATLLLLAAAGVALSMLQRPFYGRAPTLDQLFNFVLFLQLAAVTLPLPLALLLASGARRVRGVAPIVLAALLVFGLAPLFGMRLTTWLTGTRGGAQWVLAGPGLDTGFVLLALPVGLLAWWRLKRVARAYEAKRFSDAQLLLRTWWLLVVAVEAVDLVNANAHALLPVLLTALLSVAAFAPLLNAALRRAAAVAGRPPPRTLLLLRVFGDTARSEALFDRLVARWRWFGPVTMIAAPDVIARTVDPGDFLRFAAGDIGSTFVTTPQDLERRLAALDTAPDPDGRFRVNEFCCRDSSWQATVVQLIERADAVVMDLRGFNAQRAGCEFELGELARRRRPQQVVLLVDASTERARLEPWLGPPDARPAMIELPRGDAHALGRAFEGLLRAAL